MILGDLGADVIKVERPGQGDDTRHWGPPFLEGTATYFLSVNRNKRSLTLDLKSAAGSSVLWRLLERADVLVSNFRPGLMNELGFGYDDVRRRASRLVYCVINGYGESDGRASRPAFDLVIQGESGLMDLTGPADGAATKAGISIADEVAGLYLVQGVLAALLKRHRTGRGAHVEIALTDALISTFTYQAQQYLTAGMEPRRLGNAHPSLVPYRPFPTADGTVVIGVASNSLWQRFCKALELEELVDDARFCTNAGRVERRDELEALIEERLAERSSEQWIDRLRAVRVPCGVVRSVAQALDEEIELDSGLVQESGIPGLQVVGNPIRIDGSRGEPRLAPPSLGEHTIQILGELGFDSAQIALLRADGVV
jgi:crotonobetainyl-CoA:carnitine CoA-transferase CaiB-like acyl-CoA transferase